MKIIKSKIAIFILLAGFLAPAFAQVQDGVIGPGEYPFKAEYKGGAFVLHWNVTGDAVAFAMEGRTGGWVALGIEPTVVMEYADMIFGWVDSTGKTFVLDCYSTGMFGPHPPDTDLGGTEDILAFGGSERDGKTVIEFLRPLAAKDPYDKAIPPSGELKIIWAYGETDDFEEIHSAAGEGIIHISAGTSKVSRTSLLLIPHIAAMTLSLSFMLAAVITARYFRSRKWWLKAHRPLGITAAILGAVGLVFGVLLVEFGSGIHLRVAHSWFGVLTLLAVSGAPLLGQGFLKSKKHKPLLRTLHRWTGRTAVFLMTLTAILGLYQAGLL